jgi:hypothetical protein
MINLLLIDIYALKRGIEENVLDTNAGKQLSLAGTHV